MNRISNAWTLSKKSWSVLGQDRHLIAIPVIAGLGALLTFAVILFPPALAMGSFDESSSTGPALFLFGFLAMVGAAWVMAIGQAAVVAGAAQRMDGVQPTLGSAFGHARDRAFRLLEWAFMATVVSIILDQIEERLGILGRLVSWIGSMAFSVMSFLALPVILFEDVGAIEAFKRSSRMLKATWGEQLAFNFGIGLISVLVIIPGVIFGGLLIGTGFAPLVVLGVVAMIVWIVGVSATFSALSSVFKAALYRWAKGLAVDPVFEASDFQGAFRPRS